jgi:NitT/TauT family transport system permease protein
MNTRIPAFWGIHAQPGPWFSRLLACIPFILIVGFYTHFSHERHNENPQDKILPTASQMVKAFYDMGFVKDKRTGDYPLWKDTFASLRRAAFGVAIAATIGLLLGMNMALFRGLGAIFSPFITFASIVPPLALLPILFITFGVGELGKVVLISLLALTITRSIYLEVSKIPREQIIKAFTLGASQLDVVYRIVLPQIAPRLIDSIRIAFGAAWLFLIAAEAIASTEGLGYRIYLMQRYLAMDVIIPYVIWITLIGFALDKILKTILETGYGWYVETTK